MWHMKPQSFGKSELDTRWGNALLEGIESAALYVLIYRAQARSCKCNPLDEISCKELSKEEVIAAAVDGVKQLHPNNVCKNSPTVAAPVVHRQPACEADVSKAKETMSTTITAAA